ncbi:CoA-transferase family III [Podospora didyma]|uniref:CoA-transferase family III n=1 Tax=Podospora didyma TaxID=330526 RepID=A0AAE0JWT6_9PEZI|nr:CoA-transferase family III [Podospora didyma]
MELETMPGQSLGGLGLQKAWPYQSPSLSTLLLGRAPRLLPALSSYSVVAGSAQALQSLWAACESQLPNDFRHVDGVVFTSTCPNGDSIHFPTPFREQDAIAAIKALEACAAAGILDLQHGHGRSVGRRKIQVDIDKASCFLMSAYLTTVDGMGKAHPGVGSKVPDTDLNRAQSVLYRRLSANLYRTKNRGEFYHIHGSLDASETLKMIGLPPHDPKMTDYRACINTIESAVSKFTSQKLEEMNIRHGQAGVPVLTWSDFLNSSHGKALSSLPPFTVNNLETSTPRVPFSRPEMLCGGPRHVLQGIKVIEMCRVIAGPTIGRSLAAHGATVLKVTSPSLLLTGATFDALLADADVLVDGYRPGCLDRLGYGPDSLAQLAKSRGRGFVYVAEDCFGGAGIPGAEWAGRPGWQQIADCVTGVAWAQGEFMGLAEPVVPPFPMSDYGTGALGCVAAMTGLYRRATKGGSWVCRTSLCQYDVFLMRLGLLPEEEQNRLRKVHDAAFFTLHHSDSVDEVGKRALRSVKRVAPHLFSDGMMHTARSAGFDAVLRWPQEAIKVEGVRVGHVRAARPNGSDKPSWEGWEEDEILNH